MRVPLEWLKEYVTIRLKPKALADRLTMAGLEVTGIESVDGQPVFVLEITPNRADCLSILGLAREVAAMTNQRLKLPDFRLQTADFRVKKKIRTAFTIRIEDRQGCQRYIGRLIEGVNIRPSPAWMQRRLAACGIRPIQNVVDVTNYVLLEVGQPLHAFDADRLAEQSIRVRCAREEESITTLDGVSRSLAATDLVIADAKRAVAVAGVMGGVGSEVTPTTTRVLLESALFDPLRVRRTARSLGVASESSYRFERGVDPGGVDPASARAAELIHRVAGGAVSTVVDVGRRPSPKPAIVLETPRASRWLGAALTPSIIRTSLVRLGCRVASSGSGETMRVHPPSFRRDLLHAVDLYEELARLTGYDRVPARAPALGVSTQGSDLAATYWRTQSLRCFCASVGLTESIAWSLVSADELARFGFSTDAAVRLANPLSHEFAYLRPALLIGLVRAVRHNLTRGVAGVRLFEVGHVMTPAPRSPTEAWHLGLAMSGWWARDWQLKQPADFFQLKGLLETIGRRLCAGPLSVESTSIVWAEPGTGTTVRLAGASIGIAGRLAQATAAALDLPHDVWLAEVGVSGLLAHARATPTIQPPPSVPSVKRDLSVVVAERVSFAAVEVCIREAGRPLLSQLELIDRYTGPQVSAGHYSVTCALEYRDPSRTLTAAEVDAQHQRIGQALIAQLGATLR